MAGLKGRMKRAQEEAKSEGVVIELRDGTAKVFSDMEVRKEMFLAHMDLYQGESRDSEVLKAVRAATPESRQRFEERHAPITMRALIIEGGFEGAWVEEHRLLEDGTVETIFHEGGSEEAERIRLEAQKQGPAFS